MDARELVATAVLVVAVVAVVGLPATAASPALANETGGSDMGTQLTAFLQSSSAAADDTVENGMWKAGFERANESDRARMVHDRTDGLASRLARLQERNETLTERYRNGSLPEPAYVAQQSRLAARIDALQAAVNDTEVAASRAGVNTTQLMQLRRNASAMAGPAIAGVARGVVGGPDERGPRGNGPRGPVNGSAGPPADRGGGPPANATDGSGQSGPGRADGASENGTTGGEGPPANGEKGNGNDADGGRDGGAGGDGSDDSDDAGDGGRGNGNDDGRDEADGNGSDNAGDGNGSDNAGDGNGGSGSSDT